MLDHRPIRTTPGGTPPPWLRPPVVRARWRDAPAAAVGALVAACARCEGSPCLPVPVERLRSCPLPFYPGWLLLEGQAAFSEGEVGLFHLLLGPDTCHRLTGSGGTVARAMRSVLALDDPANVDRYLRFFTAVTHAADGPFVVADAVADVDFAPGVDGPRKAEAADAIAGAASCANATKGSSGAPPWQREVVVAHGQHLFRATFVVHGDGMVEMADDTPILEDVVRPPRTEDGWLILPRARDVPVAPEMPGGPRHDV